MNSPSTKNYGVFAMFRIIGLGELIDIDVSDCGRFFIQLFAAYKLRDRREYRISLNISLA